MSYKENMAWRSAQEPLVHKSQGSLLGWDSPLSLHDRP